MRITTEVSLTPEYIANELHQELKKWDKEFSKKLKETGQKFENVAIRAIYTDDLNKKVFKNKKWT